MGISSSQMLLGLLPQDPITLGHLRTPPPHLCIQPITSSLAFGISATALSSGPFCAALFHLFLLVSYQSMPGSHGGRVVEGEEAGESSRVSRRPQACDNRFRVQRGIHTRAPYKPNTHFCLHTLIIV